MGFSIFDLTNTRLSLINRKIGDFVFDVTTGEVHDSKLRITKNPVESGADIADHAILEPKVITVTGVVVGYEPPNYSKDIISDKFGFNVDDLPLPIDIKGISNQVASTIDRYVSDIITVKEEAQRILAPWLPDYLTMSNDGSQSLDRVGKAYADLQEMQRKAEMFDVVTGVAQYKNMMLTSIGLYQMHDGSAEITLTLEEVFVVESELASGINPAAMRAKSQNSGVTNLGKTQPKEDKSVIQRGSEWLIK